MFIDFEKWHGCENDFILVWSSPTLRKTIEASLIRQSPGMCSRRTGIGADGVILIEEAQEKFKPEKVLIINSDGSIAKTCGNGLRCVALSSYKKSLLEQKSRMDSLEIKTDSQSYLCQFLEQESRFPLVQMDMGRPSLDEKNSWHKDAVRFVEESFAKLSLEDLKVDIHSSDISNQHLLLFFEEEKSSPDLPTMKTIGAALQSSPLWDGINVSFVKSYKGSLDEMSQGMKALETDEAYEVFIWERGAGETPACGSAAASIASTILSSGLTPRSSWIPMKFPGGWLLAKQEDEEEGVSLSSNADFVFEGRLEI